jgi:hypothetical protein
MAEMIAIADVLNTFLISLVNFLPNLLGALVLLLIGWVVGSVVGRIVKEVIKRLKIDDLILKTKKPLFKISSIFSVIFSWAIYILFIQAAVGILGVPVIVDALGEILAFIPGLAKAIIVGIAGYAIAEYVRNNVEKSKITYSKLFANILFFLIIYITIATALPLVGIDATLINAVLLILVASFGIGMAIAIGLGMKDTVAKIAKKKFK